MKESSPKTKKSALDDLRNMKFAKKDPFTSSLAFLLLVKQIQCILSAFRLTKAPQRERSAQKNLVERKHSQNLKHSRQKHDNIRKRTYSKNSSRAEDVFSESDRDAGRQHRSTMFLLRNEQNSSQNKISPLKNVPEMARTNIKLQLDSFLSMPEERA